jgi:phosphoribosylglycinamide formyltransferase
MKRIAILASGNGSNAENITRYFSENTSVRVVLICSNNPRARVHERAARLGIPSLSFSNADFADGVSVLKSLSEAKIDFIVLAGFMNKIPDVMLQAYPEKIINIHPALLPRHGGKGMYGMHVHEAVIAAGDKVTGITIHYINGRYDEGRIIFQAQCPVLPGDSALEIAARVHALEYAYYPQVIEHVVCGSPLLDQA